MCRPPSGYTRAGGTDTRPIKTSQNFIPVTDFKTHAARIMRRLAQDEHPVVITQNGRAARVLISPDEFDQLTERERFIAAVERGLAESERGDLFDDKALDEIIRDDR